MEDEDNKLDLSRFRSHQRKFPWILIKGIVMAIIIIFLIRLLTNTLEDKSLENKNDSDWEIQIDTLNN